VIFDDIFVTTMHITHFLYRILVDFSSQWHIVLKILPDGPNPLGCGALQALGSLTKLN